MPDFITGKGRGRAVYPLHVGRALPIFLRLALQFYGQPLQFYGPIKLWARLRKAIERSGKEGSRLARALDLQVGKSPRPTDEGKPERIQAMGKEEGLNRLVTTLLFFPIEW
jgi:hypothetical protein